MLKITQYYCHYMLLSYTKSTMKMEEGTAQSNKAIDID